MITRLKVDGFKNLINTDVSFGAFSCIAGANGVGKSNLFDAIKFLSALADHKLIDAARQVRGGRVMDVKSLFNQTIGVESKKMSFLVEMIVPLKGEDDLGQQAEASITFLKYELDIGYSDDERRMSHGGLEILKEELSHINIGDSVRHLPFHPSEAWRKSAVRGRQTTKFISTEDEGTDHVQIKLHINRKQGDVKGSGGRPSSYIAANLPKTVLSEVNSAEYRTALLARREMQSWRLLQLEPTALREPDHITSPQKIAENGAHLPSTLYRLEKDSVRYDGAEPGRVYARVANRLSQLIEDVREVDVDRDEGRELLTLRVRGRNGVPHTARFLSDGTLRFLALATLEQDMGAQGVICLEEPENGIHPDRIPAILKLLRDIATDTNMQISPENPDNPLRQIIINTHSPSVVRQVDEDDLIVATPTVQSINGKPATYVRFSGLTGTWRSEISAPGVSIGQLLGYLDAGIDYDVEIDDIRVQEPPDKATQSAMLPRSRRVIDRLDVQQLRMTLISDEKE